MPDLLKICGLRDNFAEVVAATKPDLAGLIFYPPSPRHVHTPPPYPVSDTRRVGVFVSHRLPEMRTIAKDFDLHGIQLHGDQDTDTADALRADGLLVIKAIRVQAASDIAQAQAWQGHCDYLLFDAHGKRYGGNGIRFDWDLLRHYTGETPFFLSGGIGPDDAPALRAFVHPAYVGIDINSGFEEAPAKKSVSSIQYFLQQLKANAR
ncbi:MAG: phosphoribosylanthranilate isomerase [Bernardetiaceae bacterium]